jgi:hypothetical protein
MFFTVVNIGSSTTPIISNLSQASTCHTERRKTKKEQKEKSYTHSVDKGKWCGPSLKAAKKWQCSISRNTFREPLQNRMNTIFGKEISFSLYKRPTYFLCLVCKKLCMHIVVLCVLPAVFYSMIVLFSYKSKNRLFSHIIAVWYLRIWLSIRRRTVCQFVDNHPRYHRLRER